MTDIAPLAREDRAAWEVLARGYKAFYKTEVAPEGYETAWERLLREDGIHGLGAKVDGKLAGITHYLFHTTVYWLTQEHNATARRLYDDVASFNGFIRYEVAL